MAWRRVWALLLQPLGVQKIFHTSPTGRKRERKREKERDIERGREREEQEKPNNAAEEKDRLYSCEAPLVRERDLWRFLCASPSSSFVLLRVPTNGAAIARIGVCSSGMQHGVGSVMTMGGVWQVCSGKKKLVARQRI